MQSRIHGKKHRGADCLTSVVAAVSGIQAALRSFTDVSLYFFADPFGQNGSDATVAVT